jgi:hypothetical protein
VANDGSEALEINNLMAKLALPREASESNGFKVLPRSLGKACLIDLQGVSAGSPKSILPQIRQTTLFSYRRRAAPQMPSP